MPYAGRRTAAAFALLLLSALVGAAHLASSDPGDERFGGRTRDAAPQDAGASAADVPAERPPRRANRAGQPVVLTDEERAQAEAVQALQDEVRRKQDAAAALARDLRPMRLPGEARPTSFGGGDVAVRLAIAARPAAAALRAPRPDPWVNFRATQRGRGAHLGPVPGTFDRALIGLPEDPPRQGLRADIYDFLGSEILDIPDLAPLPPSLTRIDRTIDFATDESFDLPFEPETFAILWRGYLDVTENGTYEFTVGSDDGARLRIGGKDVLEFTQLRPYAETSGAVELGIGRHPIELSFYENYVYATCRLFWRRPGQSEREVVPEERFSLPDELASVRPPLLLGRDPGRGAVGDEVRIRGRGFSAAPALNRVTFAGVEAEIVSASTDELVALVPIGASDGLIVVQVGPLSTRGLPFEVENLTGLYGEYHLIGTDLADWPDFDALAPYFVRLDGPFRFAEDDLWQMPYAPDVFAARWKGFLYAPESSEYAITMESDDGGEMTLGGEVVLWMPGLHPPQEQEAVVALERGFHPVTIRFFENYGIAHLQLWWRRPGDETRTLVPRGFFFAPEDVAALAEPVLRSIEPSAALAGEYVTVKGAGFGAAAWLLRAEFAGDAWTRPELIDDETLRVRVPHGCKSGGMRIHAGVKSTKVVPFTLAEDVGLRGDYFRLASGEAVDWGAAVDTFAGRVPDATRTDTRLRFDKAADWDLPFASGDFLVRWSGCLSLETAQNLEFAYQSESAGMIRVGGNVVHADHEPHTLRETFGSARLGPGEHAFEVWALCRGGTGKVHLWLNRHGLQDHMDLPVQWLRPRPPR